MTPLRPAVILKAEQGVARSTRLTILCADSRDCHCTVQWWQTDADGIARAVESTVTNLEGAIADAAACVASWEADLADPLTDEEPL